MFDTLSLYLDHSLDYWGEDGEVHNFINMDKKFFLLSWNLHNIKLTILN